MDGRMILSDIEILDLIDAGMITPAERELVGKAEGVMSFGPSSYGYDFRLGDKFARYKSRAPDDPLDPRKITEDDLIRFEATELVIPAKGFLLGTTLEYVRMPRDVTGLPHDKSTPARCGIVIQNTVVDAGFEGNITMEMYNCQPFPVVLRAGEGICQMIFLRGNPCRNSYADRNGKYMSQVGTTIPRL